MSVEIFCQKLSGLPFGKNDRKWFPSWIRRYAGWLNRSRRELLPIDEADVIRFLKSLRGNDVPACNVCRRLVRLRLIENTSSRSTIRPLSQSNKACSVWRPKSAMGLATRWWPTQ